MKKTITLIIFLLSTNAFSAGYSNWAVPTKVELVNAGVLIHGAFGDPHNCGMSDYIFVDGSNPQIDRIISISMAAFAAKREMRFFSGACTNVAFHWGNTENINLNRDAQPVYVR